MKTVFFRNLHIGKNLTNQSEPLKLTGIQQIFKLFPIHFPAFFLQQQDGTFWGRKLVNIYMFFFLCLHILYIDIVSLPQITKF